GETVREIDPAGVVLASGKLQADWIIAADGGTSRVRRQLGLDGPARHARIGIRRHYAIQPWTDTVQVHIGAGVEACVTPVGSETVCIAAMIDDNHTSFDQALARLPTLRQRLEVAPPASETRGAASVFTRALRVVSGNVALIGDAAASVDAIAGLGVTMGLRQALVVARSLKDGSLESYERAFPGLIRTAHAMTSFMLLLKRRRWLKRIVLHSMASRPWIANQLLRLHGGEALPPVNGQPEAFPVEIR
ncbi:MAG: FAD-dependent monooxygenase, partial [Acidobacteriota bacterium]